MQNSNIKGLFAIFFSLFWYIIGLCFSTPGDSKWPIFLTNEISVGMIPIISLVALTSSHPLHPPVRASEWKLSYSATKNIGLSLTAIQFNLTQLMRRDGSTGAYFGKNQVGFHSNKNREDMKLRALLLLTESKD